MKIDKNSKKAIIKNRVKLLTLDYFDLTAPMLAAEVLSTKKHKEIKTETTANKARVDLLLEWLDESAPDKAFPAFLQGIRNCDEFVLAKKIKKDAASGPTLPPLKLPGAPTTQNQANVVTTSPEKPKKPKTPKEKKIKVEGSSGPGLGSSSALPFNGLLDKDNLLSISSPASTPASRKRKSAGEKAKTPGNVSGTPKGNDTGETKVVALRQFGQPAPKKNKPALKKPLPIPVTPRTTRKSSSSEKGEDNVGAGKTKTPKSKVIKKESALSSPSAPAGTSKPKTGGKPAVVKVMTFKDVEVKQQDSRQKFKFRNPNAVTKVIHFKDKTDISYLGCPFEENKKLCEKKVELKSKEFVCEARHKSPNCKQIPRLNITCNDGTADMQLTFLKNDVETFCGKTAAELGALSVNEIKEALDKTTGKKLNIEVHCEKMKKGSKKGGVPKWNNVATIVNDLSLNGDIPSPAKKKRKM